MKPKELVEKMKAALPDGLVSVILYGSAAAGDHAGKRSDYNILVVTKSLDLDSLDALSKPARAWVKSGNPAPLLFTFDRLSRSADVFPIEILDIRQIREVLYGEDVVERLDVSGANLRLELEHELKGKLIHLRESYLVTGGRSKLVSELMVNSLSTFLVLFRAALRLYQHDIPDRKHDVLKALSEHIDFDTEVFDIIERTKKGSGLDKGTEPRDLFARYLRAIEEIADAIDSYINKQED